MSRLHLFSVVLLFVAFLPQKYEGCEHCYTTKEINDGVSQARKLLLVAPSLKKNVTSLSDKITFLDVHMTLALTEVRSSIPKLLGQAYALNGDTDDVAYFAAHASVPGKPYNEYFGIVSTIDVYGHNIRHGQMSASSVMVANLGDGSKETYNSIRVGWMVSPELYGDSYAHFYTHWNGDGYGRKGCYNMECPGFQLEQGSKVAPGAIITKAPTTGGSHHTITVKLFKERSSKNWWVYYGMDNDTPTAVGYYPGNLFAGLAEKASDIAFGGESRARRSLPTPPMGSGFLPSPSAASMSNLQFVDQDGQSIPISSDLPVIAEKPKCYYVSPIVGAKFFFGGPAGCF
ncbi:hypothetical protein PVAP13_1KG499905 [Panicum virgatum]|uniref:Neprosin PEP catalytic domain-containing protein n=1 Tax=Panicum virgatum TaxID=38727 RepID=A0A8T0XIR7_PANVG|nr:hypothetical protein PVAP13_1KG499905 [Panicum virgatum]